MDQNLGCRRAAARLMPTVDGAPDGFAARANAEARLQAFINACGGAVRQSGKETVCHCPAHEDANPSLNVRLAGSGKLLIKCRAHCETKAILQAIGWTARDLMPRSPAKQAFRAKKSATYDSVEAIAAAAAKWKTGSIESIHLYRDEQGKDVFGVVRVRRPDGTKEVPQIRPEGDGWVFGGIKGSRPLYRLPELLTAPTDAPVSVFEGEQKADLAASLGFVATSCSQGAGNAKLTDFAPLASRILLLFADNDAPGRDHMLDVAARAYAAGAVSVWMANLPGLPPKGDIVDYSNARREAGLDDEQIADEIRDAIAKAKQVSRASSSASANPSNPVSPAGDDTSSKPPPWEPFPLRALPPVCRSMVEYGAAAMGIDPAFLAVLLLGVLAAAIGATRRVRVTADWHEPAVLWVALIAVSGAIKSPALRLMLRPLRERDFRLHEQTVDAQRAYAAALDAWRAGKCRGPRPEPAPMLAMLVDDITVEALAVRLLDNPRGLLLAVDELAGWVKSWNKYRKTGDDGQRWLTIHNADALKIDRKSVPGGNAPRIYVPRAAVSVVGTIQPAIARRYLGSQEQRESGGAARLLLAAPPVVPAKWTNTTIPEDVSAGYARVAASLLDLSLNAASPRALRLDADAQDLFVAYYNDNGESTHEAACQGDGDLAAALAKLRGGTARIALVLALAEAAEHGVAETSFEIPGETMHAAITIARWFEHEARRIYSEWRTAEEADSTSGQGLPIAVAERLHKILESGPKTLNELHTLTGKNLTGDRIRAALKLLAQSGRARMSRIVGPRGGRPQEQWEVSP